jgi:hypothetical protein
MQLPVMELVCLLARRFIAEVVKLLGQVMIVSLLSKTMITMFQVMNLPCIMVFTVQLDFILTILLLVRTNNGNVSRRLYRLIIITMVITKTLRELTWLVMRVVQTLEVFAMKILTFKE